MGRVGLKQHNSFIFNDLLDKFHRFVIIVMRELFQVGGSHGTMDGNPSSYRVNPRLDN